MSAQRPVPGQERLSVVQPGAGAWDDYPMNESVYWSREEKILGVLGVAPLATVDFYRKLTDRPVKKDWQHIRVLIDSNPKLPSRGRYFDLGETDPVPFIRRGIAALAAQGASAVAIPCNTAHLLYDRYARDMEVFMPNMIEITARGTARALKATGGGDRVLVFSSALTAKNRLYEAPLATHGLSWLECGEQAFVSNCIEGVKQGRDLSGVRRAFRDFLRRQTKVDAVILGCTELSVLIDPRDVDFPVIDSNMELAEFCHGYCIGENGNKELFPNP